MKQVKLYDHLQNFQSLKNNDKKDFFCVIEPHFINFDIVDRCLGHPMDLRSEWLYSLGNIIPERIHNSANFFMRIKNCPSDSEATLTFRETESKLLDILFKQKINSYQNHEISLLEFKKYTDKVTDFRLRLLFFWILVSTPNFSCKNNNNVFFIDMSDKRERVYINRIIFVLKNLTEELNNETLNNCKIVFNKMYWEIFRTICDSN